MKDITVFGHKVSPVAAVAVGGGSLVVIWFAYKQHQASAAASTSASAIDPVTDLPYSQDNVDDPLTGMTYLGEAQQFGSVAAAEQAAAASSSLDLSSAYGTGTGAVGTSTGTSLVPSTDVQASTYASNAAWAQAAESGLTDVGYSSTDIAAALGRYLGNLSETADQVTIVTAALAEYGPPPVGSYTIIQAPATTATGSGNTGTGTSSDTGTGTTATGTSTTTAAATVSGGHVVSVNNNDAVVAWSGHNAVKYAVTIHGPGPIDGRQNTITVPEATYSGLSAGHDYTVTVVPYNAAGKAGPSGTINVKTT